MTGGATNTPSTPVIPEGALVGSGVHGGTGSVTDSIQKDVVKIAASNVATTISPWAGTNQGRHQIMYSMYQPLFEYDKATGDNVLVIAKSIDKVDPYTFKITNPDKNSASQYSLSLSQHYLAADTESNDLYYASESSIDMPDAKGTISTPCSGWVGFGDNADLIWNRILTVAGVPEEDQSELVDSFYDWIDEDSITVSSEGAESDYYEALEPPYT